MSFKDWSAVLGTWVSISAALLGGYLALQSYQEDVKTRAEEVAKRTDARVVQTFALLETFQGSEMMRIRNRMAQSYENNTVSALNGQQDFFAFVDFFDAIQVCIDRNLCEPDLAAQLFSPYAKGQFPPLRGLVQGVREAECQENTAATQPFGYGLEALATGMAPTGACAAPAAQNSDR